MAHGIVLALGQRCLVEGSLVRLGGVSLLQANLLNIIQPLIRIDKDARIVCFLLFSLLWRLETFAKMTMLSKLVEEM